MTDRPTRVLILLHSFLDWLPTLTTATGRLQQAGTTPGPAPSKVRCGLCSTVGRVVGYMDKTRPCQGCRAGGKGNHGCRGCPSCDGTGWRKPRKGDPLVEDPMLNPGANELVEQANKRSDDRRRAHAEELRLEAMFIIREQSGDPDWWLSRAIREQERMWASGSYRELGWCLTQLAEAWPRRSSLVWRHLIYAEDVERTERVERVLAETVEWLCERMPAEVKVPSELEPKTAATNGKASLHRGRTLKHVEQRTERDEHIRRQWLNLGWAVPRIAEVNALSERHVRRIVGVEESMSYGGTAA